jgi:hypothetical protein
MVGGCQSGTHRTVAVLSGQTSRDWMPGAEVSWAPSRGSEIAGSERRGILVCTAAHGLRLVLTSCSGAGSAADRSQRKPGSSPAECRVHAIRSVRSCYLEAAPDCRFQLQPGGLQLVIRCALLLAGSERTLARGQKSTAAVAGVFAMEVGARGAMTVGARLPKQLGAIRPRRTVPPLSRRLARSDHPA